METKSGRNTDLEQHVPENPLEPQESRNMVFSKSAALWVFLAVIAIAIGLLSFLYYQGGLSHAVHQ